MDPNALLCDRVGKNPGVFLPRPVGILGFIGFFEFYFFFNFRPIKSIFCLCWSFLNTI
jgi:hypothetical protein